MSAFEVGTSEVGGTDMVGGLLGRLKRTLQRLAGRAPSPVLSSSTTGTQTIANAAVDSPTLEGQL